MLACWIDSLTLKMCLLKKHPEKQVEMKQTKTSRNESMEEIQTYVQQQEVRKSSVFHFAYSWVTFKVFDTSAYSKYYCLPCIFYLY